MKRILPALLLAASLVGLTSSVTQAVVGWTPLDASQRFVWQQPSPQGNPLAAIDFVDANTGWAVGANGTVIKTTDGGYAWTQQGPIVPQGAETNVNDATDVCFVDANKGWVSAGEHVYRTTNGGATWTRTGAWYTDMSGNYISYASVDFADANNGWIVGNHKVWHTTTGGTSVTSQVLPAGASPDLVAAASSTHAYMGGIFEGYLQTTDGGATWTQRTFTGTAHTAHWTDSIAAVNGTKVYVVTGGDVLLTADAGSSWTTMTVGNASGDPVQRVCVVDGDLTGSTAYATSEAGKLYKTTNSGATGWVYCTTTPNRSPYDLDAPSSSAIFAIDNIKVVGSTDGGASFQPRYADSTERGYSSVDFTSATSGHAITPYDYASTNNGGLSWTVEDMSSRNIYMKDVFFLENDPRTGWIVGSPSSGGPSVLKTTNGGARWESQVETDMAADEVCFADADDGWATDHTFGYFWRSTDGGATWNKVIHDGFHWDVDFVDANNGWMALSTSPNTNCYVMRTSNGGSTWTTQTVATTGGSLQELDFVDANTGYAADSFANLFKTTDGGAHWNAVTLSPYLATFRITDLKFSSPTDGWIVGRQNASNLLGSYRHDFAAHTTNGGSSWDFNADPTNADSGSTGTKVGITAVDSFGSDTWIVGGNGSILKTLPHSTATITSVSRTLASYDQSCVVTGTLTYRDAPLAGKPMRLWTSGSTSGFVQSTTVATTTAGGAFSFTVRPSSATYYKVSFAGDGDAPASSASNYVKVTPVAYVGNPVAPSTMYRSRYYTVYGYLKPRHGSGTYPVRIYKWRKVSGVWRSYGNTTARASNYSTYSKYAASISLTYAGAWRLRAYHPADAGQRATWSSGYDYVTVR
ncbi:MAG: YCF48-related protein [Coriobacteriia bacterium]